MLNERTRRSAGLAAAVVGIAGLITTTPVQAEPSIHDVQSRVDTLYRQAEIASEKYNDAKLRLAGLRHELTGLKADQQRQNARLDDVRVQLRDSLLRQFEGSGISTVGQAIVADDPKEFLSDMTTASTLSDVQANLLSTYNTQVDELKIRRQATSRRAEQIAETEASLKSDKDKVESKLAAAKELLGTLKEKQREEMRQRQERLSRDASRAPTSDTPSSSDASSSAPTSSAPTSSVPASGRAQAAVDYGMAQVGDAYVWGADGPDAFDCSGFTMAAWGAAGVSLPHSSSAQYSEGRKVSKSELQPGDLVFYYSPISHVDMYIGNGKVVGAQNPSDGVTVVPLDSMPYSGAVRPG